MKLEENWQRLEHMENLRKLEECELYVRVCETNTIYMYRCSPYSETRE